MLAMDTRGDERLSTRGTPIRLPRLMLVTTSEMKREATLKALELEGVQLQDFKCSLDDSTNNHQPGHWLGSNEAKARGRVHLAMLEPTMRPKADLFLAIHVGISPATDGRSQWGLAAGAYLCDNQGNGVFAPSATLALPILAVEEVNPATTTSDLKKLVASWTNNRETDPFKHFTYGRRREEDYIIEAVRHALYPFMFAERYRKPWR